MSGEKTKLVPKLRFTEFQNAGRWQVGCIADIGTVLQGYGFPEKHQGLKNGDYPFYKVSDISKSLAAGNVFIEEAANYINQSLLKEMRAKPIPEGTTVFAKIGEAIRSNKRAITTAPCLIDNNVAGVKCIEGKATDFFIYLVTEQISLIEHAGGVVPAVNKSAIEAITVKFPTIAEQQKIADCLGSLDELIAAQARKVDALKTHKKGLMQQLFPREGETQPRLRFPEFQNAGEWEVKRMSSEVHLISGTHLSPDQYSIAGEVPYFTGPSDFTNDIKSVTKWTKRSANMAAPDDTLITVKGSGVGEVWCSTLQGVALGRQLMAVRVKQGSSQFIFQVLLTKKTRFEDLGSGNLIPGLSRTDILDMETHFPSPVEQQRIADCLTSLDNLITAATEQLQTLQTHKKGLMQQLFPSVEAVES